MLGYLQLKHVNYKWNKYKLQFSNEAKSDAARPLPSSGIAFKSSVRHLFRNLNVRVRNVLFSLSLKIYISNWKWNGCRLALSIISGRSPQNCVHQFGFESSVNLSLIIHWTLLLLKMGNWYLELPSAIKVYFQREAGGWCEFDIPTTFTSLYLIDTETLQLNNISQNSNSCPYIKRLSLALDLNKNSVFFKTLLRTLLRQCCSYCGAIFPSLSLSNIWCICWFSFTKFNYKLQILATIERTERIQTHRECDFAAAHA